MDNRPLVLCGHCGSRNRRTSEQCFICARPLTGLEVEAADVRETVGWGAGTDELGHEPRPWAPRRRRAAIVAAALAATLAVGAGVWSARGGDPVSDPFALRAAVTEEPELAWTWEAERPIRVAFPTDRGAVALLGEGEVVGLDEHGEERWRRTVPLAGYAVHDAPTNVVHVMSSGSDEGTVTALDAETGRRLWAVPGGWATTVGDATVVVAEDELRGIDTEDGSEVWSVSGGGFGGVSRDRVYGFRDGELRAWDHDGDKVWVSDVELADSSPRSGGDVVVLDDFIAVAGPGGEVVGIDLETGEELWRDDPGYDGGVGSIEPGLAFSFPPHEQALGPSSSEDGVDDPQTTVYDRDGEVATVPVAQNSFFSPVEIELEGDPHFVDMESGLIYDEDFEAVGTVPRGHAYPTLTGVYDMTDGSVSYVPYGADDPLWALDIESFDETTDLVPGDRSFLVDQGHELSLYR